MTNVELVENFCKAYDSFDIRGCCSFVHPEIKIHSLTSDKYVVEGIKNFEEFYSSTFKKFPEQNTVLKSRLVFEETVIDEEILYGRPDKPEGFHGFVIYAFRDGLIDRIWI